MIRRAIFGVLFSVLILAPASGLGAEPRSAADLLSRSIAYHDPQGLWERGAFRLTVESTTAKGETQTKEIVINNGAGRYELRETQDGQRIEQKLEGDSCAFSIDGSTDLTKKQLKKYSLSCETLKQWRNYHSFLWGLPMKLRDPGTRLDPEVRERTFEGRDVLALRITYEPEVGTDIWYMYLDPETSALVGYEFFKDEENKIGEYIVLTGEIEGGGLRLPKNRAWHTSKDGKYLATDSLAALAGD